MKHLLPLLKKIEMFMRGGRPLPPEVIEQIGELPEWDYEIVIDFQNRVNFFMQRGVNKLAWKDFERWSDEKYRRTPGQGPRKRVDLVIASLRRDFHDVVLTDIWNHFPVPGGISHEIIEIWGMLVTRARNFAVEQACRMGASYLFFIDDDIVAPVGTLYRLFELMEETKAPAVGANYFRKTEPLRSAHVTKQGEITPEDLEEGGYREADKVLAMGCTLINLREIATKVPFPLFWEFVAPDGLWAMGEDAFFTRNVIEYLGKAPIVDLDTWCLHYDKRWHKMYGERKPGVTYAVNNQFLDVDRFERLRVPPSYPTILICVPRRSEQEPIAVIPNLLKTLRGYRTELFSVTNLPVDQAREALAEEALRRNVEYLLFIDNDVVPPDDGLTMLQEAIELPGVDVVVGDYPLKGLPTNSIHTVLDSAKGGMVTELDRAEQLETHPRNPSLIKANWLVGLGFALIKTEVFRNLRKPWFKCHAKHPVQPDQGINEDAHFTELCLEAGYGVWIHRECKCFHVDFQKGEIYAFEIDPNRNYPMNPGISAFKLKTVK